jgi:hypothetical protein
MARTKVVMNSSGARDILTSSAVRAALREPAERVAAAARASAPVESGAYRDSITVEDDTTDRAVARVVARAPHARLVEARTGNLARALSSQGG